MKKTFFNLSEKKQRKIINACIREYAVNGYYKSSIDRIVKAAGISKGGIYEYIRSKEELFVYITENVYHELYQYIQEQISLRKIILPDDILDRFSLVAEIAFDFYMKNPNYIRFIVNNYHIKEISIEKKITAIFQKNFYGIFGEINKNTLKFELESVMDMLIWLLMKTRYNFLREVQSSSDAELIKKKYLENWNFYISVLKTGIYRS